MTVHEYLSATPEPQSRPLADLRSALRDILPDATETISNGVPAFTSS